VELSALMDASMTALMSSSVRQTPYVARITAAAAAAAEVICGKVGEVSRTIF